MNNCVVFGAPRSGTTYLQEALVSLRRTDGKIGQLVPVVVFHLVNQNLPSSQYEALVGSLQRGISIYLNGEYNSRFRALGDWWRAPVQWERWLHVIRKGDRPRPEWFMYKEPYLSLAPEFALDALPDAKVIYIVRDGRDVANSLVESYDVLTDQELMHLESAEMRIGRLYGERYVPWWVREGRDEQFLESSPYVRAIWLWTYMVRTCYQYFQDLGAPDQILRVQYEAFMRDPHSVGDRILDHLDKNETRAFRQHLDQARTSSIAKYERRSQSEIDAAVEIAEDTLKLLGYE